jgi:hypothetical protein
MSIGEVVAETLADCAALPTADLHAIATWIDTDAAPKLYPLAQESHRPELPAAVTTLGEALESLDRALYLIASAQQKLTSYCQRLTADPGHHTATVKPPSVTHDPKISTILTSLPLRTATNRKTHGRWIDENGTEQDEIVSGNDADSERAIAELTKLGLNPRTGTLSVATHVEVKFAVRARQEEQQNATLIINNVPCRVGRFSCEQLLPNILRPGQQITVHWPGGRKTYTGRKPRT